MYYKIKFCTVHLLYLFMISCSEINEQLPPTNYFDTTIELQSEVFHLIPITYIIPAIY